MMNFIEDLRGDNTSRISKIPFKPVVFSASSLSSAPSSITCDNIKCVKNIIFGNDKTGENIHFLCSNCPKENATRYCSELCQKVSWKYHKKWCGKLTNPDIKKAICYSRDDDCCDIEKSKEKDDSKGEFSDEITSIRLSIARCLAGFRELPFSLKDCLLFEEESSNSVKEFDSKLQKLQEKKKVDTIIFILQHAWVHTLHKEGQGKSTIFEVKLRQKEFQPEGSISLLNNESLKSISSYLLKYMFDNEDRMESASYIVLKNGSLKKGLHYPPGMAKKMGLKLDNNGKIIDLGIVGSGLVTFMGLPSLLRYESNEPFGIGEMTLEDISHTNEIRIFADSKLPNGVVICHDAYFTA